MRSFITCTLCQEDEMGRAFSTNVRKQEGILGFGRKTRRKETTMKT
jgi:hypothetical protein